MSITEVIAMVVTVIAVPISMWFMYKFIAVSNKVKEVCSSELPYKVDPVHTTTTVDLAIPDIPHEPIKWTFANAPKPTRTYKRRSKYWTDKRKKAAAAKTRKTKRKSK